MINALVIYWIIAGFATYLLHPDKSGFGLTAAMILGGIAIPARIIAKVAR